MSLDPQLSTSTQLNLDLSSFSYAEASEPLLHDLALNLSPGSLILITGGSGSGKSTLGAILAGLLPRPGLDQLSASFTLAGQRLHFTPQTTHRINPAQWAQHVGMLPQDASLYLSGIRESAAEEIAFGMENAGVPREQMHHRVAETARLLGITHLLDRDPSRLSGGQQRLLALAALTVMKPAVLVLDEPFAGLDTRAAAMVSEALARLRAAGTALVVLCSDAHLPQLEATRRVVLADGTLAELGEQEEPLSDPAPRPAVQFENAPVRLDLRGVSLSYQGHTEPVVKDLDLQVRAGECLGLQGPNGSGKSTLLKAAAGLLQPCKGSIHTNSPTGLLLQNPADQLFERTVRREVGFGVPRRQAAAVDEILAEVGLQSVADEHPYELSASQRRLVALATVLIRRPSVLLLDEPTEDLDREGLAALDRVCTKALAAGAAVVVSSHDSGFIRSTAHRIHHMSHGDSVERR